MNKEELYDKCENMEQLYDKYYLPLQQQNKELHNKIDISIGILKTWKDYCKVNHKNSDDFDKEHWTYCIEKIEGLEEVLKDSDVDE